MGMNIKIALSPIYGKVQSLLKDLKARLATEGDSSTFATAYVIVRA